MFQNPNISCDLNCRFQEVGPSMMTDMYFPPVYDKNGVNLNPDCNTTSGSIKCNTCGKEWKYSSCQGKTTYIEIED